MVYHAKSTDELLSVAEAVIGQVEEGYRVILLYGEMGAGKTTFAKALCQQLGVMEPVSSPTFSLIQEYRSPGHGVIYHMDFYRLEKDTDLQQIGLAEYLDSGNICLIEWPGLAMTYFSMPHLQIEIIPGQDNIRILRVTKHDAVDT